MKKLALLGGEPVRDEPFPAWPIYEEDEKEALSQVLESRVWWRTPGTQTLEFEREFATYHEAQHGIACTNGTAAIEIVLAALRIGLGDEVIVPNYTFVATASAVLAHGALPVLIDVDPHSYCLDPEKVESAINERTKAIIAVHMGGHPADLDQLSKIAKQHHLSLIEDCAHAHGSEWHGKKVGTFGAAGTFSFQSSKLMTAGEGGMIVTNDDALEEKIRSIHDCGRLPGEWFYAHFQYGSNYRMTEWQGAVLRQQLNRLPEQSAVRTRNAAYLNNALAEVDGITPQILDARCTQNGHYAYIFHYDRDTFNGLSTDQFINAMNAEGIPNQAAYPPLNELALFQSGAYRERLLPEVRDDNHDFLNDSFPGTQRGAWETFWLPQYVLLGAEKDMADIITAIRKIQRQANQITQEIAQKHRQ